MITREKAKKGTAASSEKDRKLFIDQVEGKRKEKSDSHRVQQESHRENDFECTKQRKFEL